MKKNQEREVVKAPSLQFSLKMKLTTLFVWVCMFEIAANSYSQNTKISLDIKQASIETVLNTIAEKSDYQFFYNKIDFDTQQKVTIFAANEPVTSILDRLLQKRNISHDLVNSHIVLFPSSKIKKQSLLQQEILSTGTVVDAYGIPVPGVSVTVKGKSQGTLTDFDGNFAIRVQPGSVLQFSFMGFETQMITVVDETSLNIQLKEASQELDEVVVVGYGELKRTEVTGAISSVDATSLEKLAVPSVDARLQGQVAGLNIGATSGEPGATTNIRIRGNNSISGSNRPLFVIDGYPMDEGAEAASWGDGGASYDVAMNPLSMINPDDIESIEVLKDASATAIYGSRGANGVIVITTKSGKIGKAAVTFSTRQSISPVPTYFDMMSGSEWRQHFNWFQENIEGNEPRYSSEEIANAPNTNWMKEISQVGQMQQYALTAKGGSDKVKYYLSADYLDQKGVIINSDYTRANVRSKIDARLNDKWSANLNINYNRSYAQRRTVSSYSVDFGGPVFRSLIAHPDKLPLDDQGFNTELDDQGDFYANPLSEARDLFNLTDNQSTMINLMLRYKITNGLTFVISSGNSNITSLREMFFPSNTSGGNRFNGRGVYNTSFVNTYRFEPYVNYIKKIKSHNLNFTLGASYNTTGMKSLLYSATNFPSDTFGSDAMHLGADIFQRSNNKMERSLKSAYYRANYNFKGQYFLSFTGRYDGASVLAEGEKWLFFPAFSAGWTMSKASFMRPFKSLSNLKLRGSYGKTGSQSVAPYSTFTLLSKQNPPLNGSEQFGQGLDINLGNQNLTWEVTTQADIGVDLGFLNNRYSLTFDYYDKSTDGLLQNKQLPPSSGFIQTRANLGTIKNSGIELAIKAGIIENTNFNWSTGLTFSNNKTEVVNLGDANVIIEGKNLVNGLISEPSNIMQQGKPFGAFMGYRVEGLLQADDFDTNGEPLVPLFNSERTLGSWKYKDLNNDGVINSADREIIGDPNPDFTMGWTNNFSYKRFSLSTVVYASVGADILHAMRAFNYTGTSKFNGRSEWYQNRWTQENQHNNPLYPSYTPNTNLQVNDQMVEDGTYIRLNNVTLSYQIPSFSVFNSVQLNLTGTNLYTYTNYTGFNPHVNSRGTNTIIQNVDLGGYPTPQTYTLGITLNF